MMDIARIHPWLMSSTILIVDNDSQARSLLEATLRYQGFTVYSTGCGRTATELARTVSPDAVILAMALPGIDGVALLREFRSDGLEAPALFVSSATALCDKIRALTGGGDDYVTKPFSLEELVTRLLVVLRRCKTTDGSDRVTRRFFDIVLDLETREAWKAGRPVSLSPTEFRLLDYFIVNSGIALSKTTIMQHVLGLDCGSGVNVVESYVGYLRRKVDTGNVRMLHTLGNVGYVLRQPQRQYRDEATSNLAQHVGGESMQQLAMRALAENVH